MRITFQIIICLLFSQLIHGQTKVKYKSFRDSSFSINDIIISPQLVFSLSGSSHGFKPFDDSVSTIANFLLTHPKLKVELGGHTDSRGNDKANLALSTYRMQSIKDALIFQHKIDSSRVRIKGYGEYSPIISEKIINSAKTKKEKENYYTKNRRTEIKIIGN